MRVPLVETALLLALVIVLVGCGNAAGVPDVDKKAASKAVAPKVGYHAPDFTLPNLQGQEVRLSDLRGKPVLLNFWATWCNSCREELPIIEAIVKEYGGTITVLGVSIQEDPVAVERFVERANISIDVLVDPDGSAAGVYSVFGLPTTYFIDKGGVIRSINVGPMSQEAFADRIKELLSQSE